ncbi:MAG: MFS transporter [Deltaproteobacteria bacterium]|nr:MFS transporter [Deltaproteobacteria bacterium]
MAEHERRNFAGGVWHGAWLAAGQALADPLSVLPAFVDLLTGSSVWVGGLSAILAASGAAPQVVVARFVEPLRRKKGVLLGAIYVRAASWGALGVLIALGGASRPRLLLAGMVGLLALFSAAGAVGNVPYVDLIGKVIPRTGRGSFFGTRQAVGGVLALVASALSGTVLGWSYPLNYAALFGISAGLLAVASLGIQVMEEPLVEPPPPRPWGDWFASLRGPLRELLPLALVFWSTGASLLALPMYVVAARAVGAPTTALPWFIAASVSGGLIANLLWARLVDRLGARRMILVCVGLASTTPFLALWALHLGWPALVGVLFLAGATQGGRKVGFAAALLEEAPPARRGAYGATYALLGLPVALLPLLGGVLAAWSSFEVLFALTGGLLVLSLGVVGPWALRDGRDTLAG